MKEIVNQKLQFFLSTSFLKGRLENKSKKLSNLEKKKIVFNTTKNFFPMKLFKQQVRYFFSYMSFNAVSRF